jgi:hypothetical protein
MQANSNNKWGVQSWSVNTTKDCLHRAVGKLPTPVQRTAQAFEYVHRAWGRMLTPAASLDR